MYEVEYMSTEDHPDWWRPIGGQNSQDSILERRSLVWNDNEVEAPNAPPAFKTAVDDYAKFFSRGARGKIERIEIYSTGNGAAVINIDLTVFPCLGPMQTVTIVPGVGWAWYGVDLEEMWNYDSLFLWLEQVDALVSWGYDAVQPYDGHLTTDAGATWDDQAVRPFIRVIYSSETPGDVPVSGIINNIPIPYVATDYESGGYLYGGGAAAQIVAVPGAGYCDLIVLDVDALAACNTTAIIVNCDGVNAMFFRFSELFAFGCTAQTPGLSLTAYGVGAYCCVLITKRFEFRRELSIWVQNGVAQTGSYWAHPTLLR